jgi:hypothetical protein
MRTARLDHNPYARPAPVSMHLAPKRDVTPADRAIAVQMIPTPQRIAVPPKPVVRKVQRKTGKVLRPTQPGQLSNTQCGIRADWPAVIDRLAKCPDIGMLKTLANLIGINRCSLSEIRNKHSLPGERSGRKLAALWAEKIGGPLP